MTARIFGWFISWFLGWLMQRPVILRSIFYLARDKFPVLVFQESAIVFRYQDVANVMKRDKDFTVESLIAPRIESGKFILCMDDGDMYQKQERALMHVACPDGCESDSNIVRIIEKKTQKYATHYLKLNCSKPDSKTNFVFIDIVHNFCELVVARVVAECFLGIDVAEEELRDFGRDLNELAVPILMPTNDSSKKAEDAFKRIKKRIKKHKDMNHILPDSLLGRLVSESDTNDNRKSFHLPMNKDDAIRIVLGLSIAGFAPVVKTFTQTLDQLIQRQNRLNEISRAICKEDKPTVRQYIYEAQRFNPTFPFLIRSCPRATMIGSGKHRKRVNAGSVVTVALLSAMFDPESIGEPTRYRTDRDPNEYFHFGHGIHKCYGEQMAMGLIEAMIEVLLVSAFDGSDQELKSTLKRDRKKINEGHICYKHNGPLVESLLVKFIPRGEQ